MEATKDLKRSTSVGPADANGGRPRLAAIGRFLLFAIVMVATLLLIRFAMTKRAATADLLRSAASGDLDPRLIWIVDGAALVAAFIYTWIAAHYEGRSLAVYGLPLRSAFGALWGAGLFLGFALAVLDMCLTWLLGGYSFGTVALSMPALFKFGLLWIGAFLLVGIFEEYLYRGYALYTLSTGIGFWPAAVFLAVIFGGLHLLNAGEGPVGALDVVLYALFASLTLQRTGSLWFAIGVHSAWDFSLTFIFSAPGSGSRARGSLLNSSLHGSTWLTGGSAGPEGSVIGLSVLAMALLACIRFMPRRTGKASAESDMSQGSGAISDR